FIWRTGQSFGTIVYLRRHHRIGGAPQTLGIQFAVAAREGEAEAFERADEVAFKPHFALAVDFGGYHSFVFQMAEQHAGAPVDETLSEPLVQSVTQPVLYVPCLFAPISGVFKPVFTVRDKGPGADLLDPIAECVNVALRIVAKPHLLGNPIGADPINSSQIRINPGDDFAMRGR